MTSHPFTDVNLKQYISGIDAAFESENIADSLIMAGQDVKTLIPPALYDKLCGTLPDDDTEVWAEARERLRYCLAPLAFHKHFIWLQLRVSSNSITTVKSSSETTAFKYQTDEAKENLLLRHGVFFKEMIDYFNEQSIIITEWADSNEKNELDALFIKNYRDFDKHYNTNADAAFFIRSRSIQQECADVVNASINLKALNATETPDRDEVLILKVKKAIVYLTINRCIAEWPDEILPSTLRRNIADEVGKTKGGSPDAAKTLLAAKYEAFAKQFLTDVQNRLVVKKANTDTPTEPVIIVSETINIGNKYYSSI